MAEPRICSQCGASPTRVKGLCERCYRMQLLQEHPNTDKIPQRVGWTTYLEEIAARNRIWYEQHYKEKLMRERAAGQQRRAARRSQPKE